MYKLLIVDDEEMVRDVIKRKMNWEELGFQCIGDCEDGQEALAMIEREVPDIVITDIEMPFMNGLELTKELSLRYPQIKVVLFTGYNDFEFAQQAVKLKAIDYILKPVTAAELQSVLGKIKEQLDFEKRHKQEHEQLKQQIKENIPLLKERFLERMFMLPMTEKAMAENFAFFNIHWMGNYVIEAAIHIDEFINKDDLNTTDRELYHFAVFNIIQEISGKCLGTEVFRDLEQRVIVLFTGSDRVELQARALSSANEMLTSISHYLPVLVSVGIGRVGSFSEPVHDVHQSALSALGYRFVLGMGRIIQIDDVEKRNYPALLPVVALENELVLHLKTGTTQQMESWVTRLFETFRENVFPIDVCLLYVQRIVLTLYHTRYELNEHERDGGNQLEHAMAAINRFQTLDELQGWIRNLCDTAIDSIHKLREDQNNSLLEKAVAYIKMNYQDPDLSLTSICAYVSLSVSYFSVLFKKYTGQTFIECLTQVRMEKAKELLKTTHLKNYEIAHAVGFSDSQYFSGAFKKYVGDSPTDYRIKIPTQERVTKH